MAKSEGALLRFALTFAVQGGYTFGLNFLLQ